MANDHYVARTYLERFAGSNGMLRAYRKSDLATFPCWPKDICRELDGDIVPDFMVDPTYLGQYRKLVERYWKPAVAELEQRAISVETKLAVAGYAANLLVTTPAMTRLFVEAKNRAVVENVRAIQTLNTRIGKADPEIEAALQSIDAGEIIVATEPDYIRSRMASRLMTYWWALFDADWLIIEAAEASQFVTSDNPVAFNDPGPFRGRESRLRRFLPLTPKLALVVTMDVVPGNEPDFSKPPKGVAKHALVSAERVAEVNRAVIQCAEDLVICAGENADVADLVRAFAMFRTEHEYLEFERDQSIYQGIRLRARARPA
jgi:Protein of unknown function (DUF4238)